MSLTESGDNSPGRFFLTTPMVVSGTLLGVSVIGSITVLALYDKDASQVVQLINLLLSTVGMLTGSGAFVYAGAAARQSRQAAVQTNGGLEARIEAAVTRVLDARENREVSSNA